MAESSNPDGCDFCGLPMPGQGPQYCSRTCYDLWLVTPVGDEPWQESDEAPRREQPPQCRCLHCACTVASDRRHQTERVGCHCGSCIFGQSQFDRLVAEGEASREANDE